MRARVGSRPGAGEIAAAGIAFVAHRVIGVLLRLLGFRRTMRLADALTAHRERGVQVSTLAARLGPVVSALDRAGARWPRRGRCLRRSLALWFWLRLRGVSAVVELGVRRTPEGLVGHAWVSCDGVAIAEAEDPLVDHVAFVRGGHRAR